VATENEYYVGAGKLVIELVILPNLRGQIMQALVHLFLVSIASGSDRVAFHVTINAKKNRVATAAGSNTENDEYRALSSRYSG